MKELANIFNLSESTISLYERGKHEPELDTLKKFADYFEVSIDYLLGNESPNKKPNPKENHITIIGRGGLIKEYDLPPENVAALETILENLKNKED